MSAKAGFFSILVVPVLCAAPLFGGDPHGRQEGSDLDDLPEASSGDMLPDPGTSAGPHLSSWLTYSRPDCCGPVGGDGLITYELYVQSGPSLHFHDSLVGQALDTGWVVQGGGRSLFFNPSQTAAWNIDLGLSYMYNHSGHPDIDFQFLGAPVHISTLHRTFVNLGGGRDWYLRKPANAGGVNWRFGLDGGGRWGSANMSLYREDVPGGLFERISDTIGGAYAAVHTDVEIPWGCCTLQGGFRAEYDYTWMDIVPPKSDLQDINFLLTLGVRF